MKTSELFWCDICEDWGIDEPVLKGLPSGMHEIDVCESCAPEIISIAEIEGIDVSWYQRMARPVKPRYWLAANC